MKFRLLLAIFGLIFIIAACGPTPQIRSDRYLFDTSVVSLDPCGPPCWRGITPGETNWDDAITIVEDATDINELQIQADEESERIAAAWNAAEGELCCQMFTDDGETISFLIIQTTPDTTLGEVIEQHGDPDYAIGETLTDDQGLFSLFYQDIPMLLYVFIAGESGELSATSEVVGFAYMTDDTMQLLIDSADPGLHAWDGYQSFTTYMDGEFEVTPVITLTPSEE